MKSHMKIDEVFEAYPDEWVLLDELESHDNLTVQGGRVVGHGTDRAAIAAMAVEQDLARCAMVCTRKGVSRLYAVSPITSGA